MTSMRHRHSSALLLHPAAPLDSYQPGLRVGYVPGVMPGKWFTRWRNRYDARCQLHELALAEDRGLVSLATSADDSGFHRLTDMVFLRPEREPDAWDKEKYHTVELYREKMVLVLPQDHLLSLYEEAVPLSELAQETMLQSPQSVPRWAEISAEHRRQNPQPLPQMRSTEDAVELVAAGLGLLITPMSLARLYHRQDLTYRAIDGLDESPLALVWERRPRSEAEEAAIQDFVGICRGRTSTSWRGSPPTTEDKKSRPQGKRSQPAQKRRVAGRQKRTGARRYRRR